MKIKKFGLTLTINPPPESFRRNKDIEIWLENENNEWLLFDRSNWRPDCPICEGTGDSDFTGPRSCCGYCNGNETVSMWRWLHVKSWAINPLIQYRIWRDMPTALFKIRLTIARCLKDYAPVQEHPDQEGGQR